MLLLHGEPTWSYLYRAMIPILVDAGCRVIAPDLIGFGLSDKPAEQEDHTYARHVAWMTAFIEALAPPPATLFCQDWGGLIGLRIVAEHPEWFLRVVAANTSLPTGERPAPEEFLRWREFCRTTPTLEIGALVSGACATPLPPEAVAAYDAPFPTEAHKSGARRLPSLVPVDPSDAGAAENRRAWEALKRFDRPFLTLFSDMDPMTRNGEKAFQRLVPGAAGQPHEIIRGAGHFLQEDRGEEVARIVAAFTAST